MIVIKGPNLNEDLAIEIARQVFRVDRCAVVTLHDDKNGVTIECEKDKIQEVLNTLKLVECSLLSNR